MEALRSQQELEDHVKDILNAAKIKLTELQNEVNQVDAENSVIELEVEQSDQFKNQLQQDNKVLANNVKKLKQRNAETSKTK